MPARGQSKKKTPPRVFFFCSGPVPAPNRASPSLAFRRGRSKKKHPGWCFLLLWPRAGTGLLLPLPFRGAGAKKTPWVVFLFLLWPRRKVAAPNGAQQKRTHFAHPGPTAKNFLESNDAGHEQKGATTKKNTLARRRLLLLLVLSTILLLSLTSAFGSTCFQFRERGGSFRKLGVRV